MSDNDFIKVLDHGYVRLVDHMGGDLSIVRSARVSYDADWRAGKDAGADVKLIRYLLRNKHTSPFESVTFTFEVKAPIFIFRQWHRHRVWSFNEISARYAELPAEFYVPPPALVGRQSASSKQAREVAAVNEQSEQISEWIRIQCERAFVAYRQLMDVGAPRELARSVLPVATYSKMFATVNLHNLFRFIELRLHPHAQYEIQLYAEAMLRLVKPIVPVAVEYFEELLDE